MLEHEGVKFDQSGRCDLESFSGRADANAKETDESARRALSTLAVQRCICTRTLHVFPAEARNPKLYPEENL